MKRFVILFTMLLIIPFALQSEESIPSRGEDFNQSYVYYSIGGGFPTFVTIDLGKRIQHHHHGFEAGIGIGSPLFGLDGKFLLTTSISPIQIKIIKPILGSGGNQDMSLDLDQVCFI